MIGRPFRTYTMALVERLGFKTLRNLHEEMTSNEIMEWMAYDMLKTPELRERLEREITLEQQKTQTSEDEARLIKELLLPFGGQ